jgi:L-ascorbate metabolism protein UlaG (beta-lactamase superfamily)
MARASSRVISWNKESEAGRLIHVDHPAGFIVSSAPIARRIPVIGVAVLHAGAARVPGKFRDRPLSLDSVRAAAAAAVLGPAVVLPAHYDGWAHFSEGRADLARAFDDAGLTAQLRLSDHGTWIPLGALRPLAPPRRPLACRNRILAAP